MLRRAAPLVRVLRSATTVVQSSTAASSNGENVVRTMGKEGRGEEREGMRRDARGRDGGGGRPRHQQQRNDEHAQLMKKHAEVIENTEVHSLNDAIERIQWYSMVSHDTLKKVSIMLKESTIEELNGIPDRSMAILFSAFGEMSTGTKRDFKKSMIDETIDPMMKKGYSLGPSTRVAIFVSRIDCASTNEQLPSIVDELSAWESSSLPLNEEMVVEAARVYGLQGDRKGVIELTNYARESFGRVDSRLVEWLAHSMVTSGEGKSGVVAIEKLASHASDEAATRFWLSGAMAAARKGDTATAVECLSRVSLTAKLDNTIQNGSVAGVLMELIERGVEGAEEALTPYLSLSPDGSSLNEKHPSNGMIVLRTRRAINEQKLETATRLYALLHESNGNKGVEVELVRSLRNAFWTGEKVVDVDLDVVTRCAKRLQAKGIIEDTNAFLLERINGNKFEQFVLELNAAGTLEDAVEKCKYHKFALAKQFLKSSSLSSISNTIAVTALLYSTKMKTEEEKHLAERLVFQAAEKKPSTIVEILEVLTKEKMANAEKIASYVVSSGIQSILMEDDVLSSGRIETILQSRNMPTIRLRSFDTKLARLLIRAKDEKSIEKAVDIVSSIIISSFNKNGGNEYDQSNLAWFIGNTAIVDEKLQRMVDKLSKTGSVGFDKHAVERIKKSLKERGLEGRIEMIEALKKKSQVLQRWLASTPDELEKELNTLENGTSIKAAVLSTIRGILVNKLTSDTSMESARLIPLLERIIASFSEKKEEVEEDGEKKDPWAESRRLRQSNVLCALYGKTMRRSVMDGDWNGTKKLWMARGNLPTLPIAPSLALAFMESRGGSKEMNQEIVSTLSNLKKQIIGIPDMVELGDLLHCLSNEELNAACEWVKKELKMGEKEVARIKSARVRKTMADMIESGRLEESFDLMKESSENTKTAIGHFDVMRLAIRNDNRPILERTVNLVSSLHSKPTAILDLAFSFLLENRRQYAEQLIKNPSLLLSNSKLRFYQTHAIGEKRIDVIHSLFSILVSCPLTEEKVTNEDLNNLAISTLRAYEHEKNHEKVTAFIREIEASTLIVEKGLKELIERSKKSKRSSAV